MSNTAISASNLLNILVAQIELDLEETKLELDKAEKDIRYSDTERHEEKGFALRRLIDRADVAVTVIDRLIDKLELTHLDIALETQTRLSAVLETLVEVTDAAEVQVDHESEYFILERLIVPKAA